MRCFHNYFKNLTATRGHSHSMVPVATYVSLGKHERVLAAADLHAIGSSGVTVRDNRFVRVDVDGHDLVIGGLPSPYCLEYRKFREEYYREAVDSPLPRNPKKIVAEKDPKHDLKQKSVLNTSWLADFASTPGYHILLAHHPELVEQINASVVAGCASVDDHINLVLSGHAHGGQWRLYHPLKKKWIGVFAPGQGFWPKLMEGVHDISSGSSGTSGPSATLVISRGLANTASLPRFFNRP